MTNISQPSAQPRNAGFFSRFIALVIDIVLINLLQFMTISFIRLIVNSFKLNKIFVNLASFLTRPDVQLFLQSSISIFIGVGYILFFWTLLGYTPGKALLGLRIVRRNGQKLGFGRSIVRFVGYWISAIPLFLGFIWILFDRQRAGWHDKIAGTKVVFIPRKK